MNERSSLPLAAAPLFVELAIKRKKVCILLLLLMGLAIIACSKPQAEKLTTMTLQELYPGDILNVDSIEITDGSSGERKLFSNQKQILDKYRTRTSSDY